ncbi:hypothetical protein Tco_0836828, partial [Tanacetum coccineum]
IDKSKITRKTVKNEQARTRESEKYKAEARKAKPQSKSAKGQMGQIKSLASSHSRGATSTMVKAQRGVGFCAKILIKEAQMHPKENVTLAILRCPQFDQTATIKSSND